MRIISYESTGMVYHRPNCKYVKRIKPRNQMQIFWEHAERRGYRPCKCCDGINYLYKCELSNINNYAEQYNMDIDMKDNKLYVRTDVGGWKIIYIFREQKFILLHRNYCTGRINLEEVDKAPYHRQGDMPQAGKIMKLLKYIKKHDEFKQNTPKDYHLMPRDSKKQKKYYADARKREARRNAQKVEYLFALIESKEGIKSLSYC